MDFDPWPSVLHEWFVLVAHKMVGAGRFWKHRNGPLLQPDETDIRGWQSRDPTVSGDDLTKRSQHHGKHFECFNEF